MYNTMVYLMFTPVYPALGTVHMPHILSISFSWKFFQALFPASIQILSQVSFLIENPRGPLSFHSFFSSIMICPVSTYQIHILVQCCSVPTFLAPKYGTSLSFRKPKSRVRSSKLKHRYSRLRRKTILAIRRFFLGMSPSRIVKSRVGGVVVEVKSKLRPSYYPVLHAIL